MTATLRKLRTVREKPVKPAGLTAFSAEKKRSRKGKNPRDYSVPTKYGKYLSPSAKQERMTSPDVRDDWTVEGRITRKLMDDSEAEWLPVLSAGDWAGFGKLVVRSLRDKLKASVEDVPNPLSGFPAIEVPRHHASATCRRIAVIVSRVEIEATVTALGFAYREAVEMNRERRSLTRASMLSALELPDVIASKLGCMDIKTLGELVSKSAGDLASRNHQHGTYMHGPEIDVISERLEELGWSLRK